MCFLHQAGMTVSVSGARREEEIAAEKENPEGPWRILLVDDNLSDCALWADILQCHGCVVMLCQSGQEALKLMGRKPLTVCCWM